jgi:DNA-binding GntR family transcriptional regulator
MVYNIESTKHLEGDCVTNANEADAERSRKTRPPPTRAVACADAIRQRILDGSYAGGMQLRQDALAEELGVSRIPVREALVQLEAEGLIKIHPHRGAIVTEISAQEISELFEMRALLEPRLLELSAPNLSADDYTEIRAILKEYASELKGLHIDRWGALNTALHALLYRHAKRPRMEYTVQQLLAASDRYTRMQLYYTDGQERAEREHELIVDLCAQAQYTTAAELLRVHIVHSGEDLSRLIVERKNGATDQREVETKTAQTA